MVRVSPIRGINVGGERRIGTARNWATLTRIKALAEALEAETGRAT